MPDTPQGFKHQASSDYWLGYHNLPPGIRTLADKNFSLLKSNPRHPSLQFKKIGKVWSVRVGLHHRALATQIEGGFLWFWIGPHGIYDYKI
ncbi:MAG: hypothetical protein LBK76_03660 [Verrucomicrobiales bacterium]|nr:hypothetical protein [Verrucomicrobiales bacterium]